MDIDVSTKWNVTLTSTAPPTWALWPIQWFQIHPLYMFDCWTEKRWKIISMSEDLTVGIPIQLVNKPGLLIEWEYKRQYLDFKINLASTTACTTLYWCITSSCINLDDRKKHLRWEMLLNPTSQLECLEALIWLKKGNSYSPRRR